MDHHVQVVQLGLHKLPEACLAIGRRVLYATFKRQWHHTTKSEQSYVFELLRDTLLR